MLTSALLAPEQREAHLGRDFPNVLIWWEGHKLNTHFSKAGRLLGGGGQEVAHPSTPT